MILVDTSVLIDYLSGTQNAAGDKLEYIFNHNIPYGINVYIYQELLQGVANEKEFKKLKTYLDTQKFYPLKKGRESYAEAAKIYFRCRKAGYKIKSTIDLLIVQTALEHNLFLLHNDTDFFHIKKIIKNLNFF